MMVLATWSKIEMEVWELDIGTHHCMLVANYKACLVCHFPMTSDWALAKHPISDIFLYLHVIRLISMLMLVIIRCNPSHQSFGMEIEEYASMFPAYTLTYIISQSGASMLPA